VVEDGATAPIAVQWAESIGLDRSVARRGLAVVPKLADAVGLLGLPGVRVCRPLTPRLLAA
jgi:hypothetical protein